MNRVLLHVCLRASWSGGRADRRRALTVAVAAGVLTVLLCGCLAAWLMASRVDDRARNRAFDPVVAGEAPALAGHTMFDETGDGRQIYIYWRRILDPAVRIPGVPANPAPGSWFVSPALASLVETDPTLRQRFPGAELIGEEGVSTAEELIAYRFVGADVQLPELYSARPSDSWLGVGADLNPFLVALAAVALVGVPGVGLLLAAMAPSAVSLEHRTAVFTALGASSGIRHRLCFLHAAVTVLPAAVVCAAAWILLSPRLTSVPIVGRPVFAGDLSIPVAGAVGVVVVIVVLSGLVASLRPAGRAGNRPVARVPEPPRTGRAVPLAAGVVTMLVGVGTSGRLGAQLYLTGVTAATIGVVLALPFLLDRVGRALTRDGEIVRLLVGRRLQIGAVATARGLVAVGALTILTPVVVTWYEVASRIDPPNNSEVQAVELQGPLSDQEVADLGDRLGAVPLRVLSDPDGGSEDVLVGDCARLDEQLPVESCAANGDFRLATGAGPALGGYEGLDGLATAPAGRLPVSTLFVSDDWDVVAGELRTFAANAPITGLSVRTPARYPLHESPLVDWLLGATAIAAAMAGLGVALSVVGQAARMAASRVRLRGVGADVRDIGKLASLESSLSVGLVGVAGTVAGGVASVLYTQIDDAATLPVAALAILLVLVVAASTLSGAAAWSVTTDPLAAIRRDRGAD